jgi:hypothetical protein
MLRIIAQVARMSQLQASCETDAVLLGPRGQVLLAAGLARRGRYPEKEIFQSACDFSATAFLNSLG